MERTMATGNLKVTDLNTERRNFPGVQVNKYYSLAEMQSKYQQSGTTDTDSQTDDRKGKESGYAPIYQKHGKAQPMGGQKLGTTVKLDKNARVG